MRGARTGTKIGRRQSVAPTRSWSSSRDAPLPPESSHPRELSELLGVPVGTLANWRSARTGPPFVKVGRHVRYRTGDVDEWIAARVFVPETVTPHR